MLSSTRTVRIRLATLATALAAAGAAAVGLAAPASASAASCLPGVFCAYADAHWGGVVLQSRAGRGSNRVDVANDMVSSVINNTGSQWLGVNTRSRRSDQVVFRSGPYSDNAYVGNSANDKIDHFDVR